MSERACRSLAAKNLRRHTWRGSRSRVPFWLELAVGLVLWAGWKVWDAVWPRRWRG